MDLIDRDEIRTIIFTTGRSNGKTAFAEAISTIINGAQKVDAEPVRHGKWKHWARRIICSECGTALHDNIFRYYRHEPRYCPECGAKMDGEQEKNEKAFWPRYLLKPCAEEEEEQNENKN